MGESKVLYDTVIKNSLCIGCGACAIVKDSPFHIHQDKYGNIVAGGSEAEIEQSNAEVLQVCPFSGQSKNEDEIGARFFPDNKPNSHLGAFIKTYAGYVNDDNVRKIASSGGIGKWLGHALLREKKVDYYIQVTENKTGKASDELFKYAVFTDSQEVISGSTSAYYPTTLVDMIRVISSTDGKYAITGVPCFIKTLRLLMMKDPILNERIVYTVGIVCGGMKSANQAKMISWQLGVHPDNLSKINFRGKKYGETPATTKIYQVWSEKDDKIYQKQSNEIFGADYGMGFFKPKACDFCDDVVGETADISIGDVWLPNYRFDTKGYSLIVVRNRELYDLLLASEAKGEVVLEDITSDEAIQSQQGGFRHRREGLSYRIGKRKANNEWYPKKRVAPDEYPISKHRKTIYAMREKIGMYSHKSFLNALENDNPKLFFDEMKPLEVKYFKLIYGTKFQRGIKKIRRKLGL